MNGLAGDIGGIAGQQEGDQRAGIVGYAECPEASFRVKPGATLLTVIPDGASWLASVLASDSMAALAAAVAAKIPSAA